MMIDSYHIKPGYEANLLPITNDSVSGESYWSPARISNSIVYQYDVYRYASKLVRELGVRRVCDIGCGPAAKLVEMLTDNPGLDIVGIDQASAIGLCRKLYDSGSWIIDDFDNPASLDQIPRSDLVICSDVIEHVHNPDNILNYIRNCLLPSGHAIVSTPERDLLRGKSCMTSPHLHHVREWNKEEFSAYLSSRGFEIVEHILQRPFRLGFHRPLFEHILRNTSRGRPLKHNQVVLIKPH